MDNIDLFEQPPVTAKPRLTTRNPERYVTFYERTCENLSERTPIEMRTVAYENTITAWLNNHYLPTVNTCCAHCGKGNEPLVAVGVKPNIGLLHPICWQQWSRDRRRQAVEALREMGITAGGVR